MTRSIAGLPDEPGYQSRSTSNLMSSADALDYIRSLDIMQVDASLDRYSYSCPGGSGQFVILDGRIVQLPQTDNEVLFIRPGDITGGFRVRTPDGTNYDFAVAEHSDFLYQTMNLSAPPYCYSYNAISAWHLSRITSPSGETVTYEYADMPSWTRDHNRTTRNRTIYRNSCLPFDHNDPEYDNIYNDPQFH